MKFTFNTVILKDRVAVLCQPVILELDQFRSISVKSRYPYQAQTSEDLQKYHGFDPVETFVDVEFSEDSSIPPTLYTFPAEEFVMLASFFNNSVMAELKSLDRRLNGEEEDDCCDEEEPSEDE